jgi:hypothetical protein
LTSFQGISLARCRPSAWLRKVVPVRCADDAGGALAAAPSIRRQVFGCRSEFSSAWAQRCSRHPRRIAGAPPRPYPWPPVHGSRSTVPTCRWGTAGEPAQLASWSARCPMSLSRMWLAAFRMMDRSVGRQGCGQLLAALAASTSTPCSLTVTGPARTSPRPCGHP